MIITLSSKSHGVREGNSLHKVVFQSKNVSVKRQGVLLSISFSVGISIICRNVYCTMRITVLPISFTVTFSPFFYRDILKDFGKVFPLFPCMPLLLLLIFQSYSAALSISKRIHEILNGSHFNFFHFPARFWQLLHFVIYM